MTVDSGQLSLEAITNYQLSIPNYQIMPNLKEFLEACEKLGTLRLIVTSSAAVLEVRGSIHKLFYAELPKGKYANMHAEIFEFHLNMDKIKQVKFETGEAKRGNFTTYAIQWGKPGEYEPGQVENWHELKEKYGEVWEPAPVETLEK